MANRRDSASGQGDQARAQKAASGDQKRLALGLATRTEMRGSEIAFALLFVALIVGAYELAGLLVRVASHAMGIH